jgi:hypothetical protein
MKRNEVEGFRLTPEQTKFQRTYRQVQKIAKHLQRELQATAQKGNTLSQMMQEVTGQMNQLLQVAPPNPLKELSGQATELKESSTESMF